MTRCVSPTGPQTGSLKSSAQEYKLLRDIPLSDVQTVAEVQVKRHDHTFGIVTPQRTYYVEANSRSQMLDWVTKITETKATALRSLEEENSSATQLDQDPNATREIPSTNVDPPTPSAPSHAQPIPMAAPVSPSGAGAAGYQYGSYHSSVTTDTSQLSSSLTSQTSTDPEPLSLPHLGPTTPTESYNTNPSRRSRDGGYASSGNDGPSYFNSAHHPGPTKHASTLSAADHVQSSSEEEEDDDFDQEPYTPGPLSPLASPRSPSVALPPDPTKVIIQGYLMKQGKRKTWRKRYFQMVSHRLVYAKSHMDTKIQRSIPIARILDVMEFDGKVGGGPVALRVIGRSQSQLNASASGSSANASASAGLGLSGMKSEGLEGSAAEGGKKYDHCFKVITAKRTFLLCAPVSLPTLSQWVYAHAESVG